MERLSSSKQPLRPLSPLWQENSAPELVLLLNPDAEPVGAAIGEMARFLEAHPAVGGVGARLEYPDGRFQHGAFAFPGLAQLWFDLFPPRPARLLDSRLNGRYPRSQYDAGTPFPIGFALGASLMVRRAAIDAAGLLDEGYFMYAEEVDWCWRMQRAGWPFFCVPAARVIHHGGASTRQFRSQSTLNLWRSRRRLYDRFYGPAKRAAARGIVRLGMLAEARRATAAQRRGEISGDEERERIATAAAVRQLFTQRGSL
jgi:GT2 family glycosyltransferase